MKTKEFEELIESATRYYAGESYSLSDERYDELLRMKKSEDPEFDIFQAIGYIGVDKSDDGNHMIEFPPFGKTYIKDDYMPNEYIEKGPFADYFKEKMEAGAKWYYKYDGCSLILYYNPTTGELEDIITRSNEVKGKRRYKNFVRLVPKQIPTGIRAVCCEVMVPLEHGYKFTSRNKANGLTSSKYKIDEIMECCTVVGCGLVFAPTLKVLEPGKKWTLDQPTMSGEYHNKILRTLPNKVMDKRITFYPAPEVDVTKMKSFFVRDVVTEGDITSTYDYIVDGIVLRMEDYTEAYKAYCLDRAEVVVEAIRWDNTSLELKVPTVGIEITELEGVTINSCASGGINNLIDKGIAPGALVSVGRAGMTTPQILKVIERNDKLEIPNCTCGYKFDLEKDVIGQGLLCKNPGCELKLTNRTKWFTGYSADRIRMVASSKPAEIFVSPLNIMGSFRIRAEWNDQIVETLFRFIEEMDSESYINLISEMYSFTPLQLQFVESNSYALMHVIHNILY